MKRWPLIVLALLLPLAAAAQSDSLYLDSTIVTAGKRTSLLNAVPGRPAVVEMEKLKALPSILGNADPVHFAQLLPSMQTSSEIDAGIHIQGCDNQHNMVSSAGVPIYGASHLLGLFSVFNPGHYGAMSYSTVATEVNRLGGQIDMSLPTKLPERLQGEASVGLLSAQGTLKVPIGDKAGLWVSARRSYINLLYGNFLRFEDEPLRYNFGDYNVTAFWQPTKKDRLWLDFYMGNDGMKYSTGAYDFSFHMDWGSTLVGLHHQHDKFTQSLYWTRYGMDVDVALSTMGGSMPSHIQTYGYKADWKPGKWHLGADVAWHEAQPQSPVIYGGVAAAAPEPRQNALEATVSATYRQTFGYQWTVEGGLKGHYYRSPEREPFWDLSPHALVSLNLYQAGRIDLKAGYQHQYLFQTGVSNVGFPTEFWFLAGKYGRPQSSLYSSLSYNASFRQESLKFTAELYYRKLYDQVEYNGDLLQLMLASYTLDQSLLHGNGQSYGLNLMLHKLTGRLTGWVGYAYGRSLRTFDGKTYPSNHERLHELNVVATYDMGKWDFGGTLVAAGGTPFTAPDSFYLLEGQLVSHFGEHNANRLRPYIRLDLSANYYFKRENGRERGLNLSIYNASMLQNDLYFRLVVDSDDNTFYYKPMALVLRILPSVSYFVKF